MMLVERSIDWPLTTFDLKLRLSNETTNGLIFVIISRRRFSTPTAATTSQQHRKADDSDTINSNSNHHHNSNKMTKDSDPSSEEVYGIVRTAPPPQQPQEDNVVRVRDPAKEIYGLLRSSGRRQPQQPPVYGSVRTHAPVKSEPTYLDVLQQKLFGAKQTGNQDDFEEPSYGVTRYQSPESSHPASSSSSSFEAVRDLLSSENAVENTDFGASDSGKEEGSSFDLIRERLLNTRPRSPTTKHDAEQNKSLRRKNSKKRRRNVSLNYYFFKRTVPGLWLILNGPLRVPFPITYFR